MKITSVDILRLTSGKAAIEKSSWNPTVVRINTSDGISGYGEIGLAYGQASNAAYGILQDFAKLVIGMDPMNNEQIWEKIFRKTFWGQGGGTVIFSGISALDIALWDIKGKALGVPCYQLLGGKTNEKLRAYASQIQFDWGPKASALVHPEQYGESARKAMADGYTCVKVDPIGFDMQGRWMTWNTTGILPRDLVKIAVKRLQAIRDAGPDLDIIVELHSLTDTNAAIQFAREIEGLPCFYYEEPVMPLNSASMKEVARNVRIPIASGERIYTRWGYRPFFEDRSLKVIQPDLGNCGGLTEGKKICDMAHVYDAIVQVHVCGGPMATAAALQLEAVIPNFLIHEHLASALIPENIALCSYNYQPKDGYFSVPDRPGIGQELSEDAIAKAITTVVK
ncbi:MAG: mandelate racemase/muconate lactonizing enzyme family protein [Candidatus Korobacteraceae bacterium]|jgi:L-alanine-DL-glutamate epimerase-like enolase superfamily enzyme